MASNDYDDDFDDFDEEVVDLDQADEGPVATKKKATKKKAKKATKKKVTKKAPRKPAASRREEIPAKEAERSIPLLELDSADLDELPAGDEREAMDQVLGQENPWGSQDRSPLEMDSVDNTAFIEVERVKVNNPDNGYPSGEGDEGWVGKVKHEVGFQTEIRDRFGGGLYKCTGIVRGKPKQRVVRVGGPSKAVSEKDGDVDDLDNWPAGATYGGLGAGPYSSVPVGSSDPYAGIDTMSNPYEAAYGGGFGPGGFPRSRYSQRDSYGNFSQGFSQTPRRSYDDDETRELREKMERLERERHDAEKAAEIERVRREAEREKSQLENQFHRLEARMENPSNAGGDFMELMKLQLQQQQIAADERRKADERRWEMEIQERKARQETQDRRRAEEKERYDRERRERLDREERERKERAEDERRARERHDQFMQQQAAQQRDLQKLMMANSQKPSDTVALLAGLQKIASPQKNSTKELKDLLGAMAMLKEINSDTPPPPDEITKAERILKTAGEVIGPVLGGVAEAWSRGKSDGTQQAMQAMPVPATYQQQQAQVYQPTAQDHLALTDEERQAHQDAYHQQIAAQQGGQPHAAQPQAASSQEMNPEKWGVVLLYVMTAHSKGFEPMDAVREFFKDSEELQVLSAVPELAKGSKEAVAGKIKLAKATGAITDARYVQAMDRYLTLMGTPDGQEWLDRFFSVIKQGWEEYQEVIAAQSQAQAVQAQPVQAQPVQAAPAEPALPAAPVENQETPQEG